MHNFYIKGFNLIIVSSTCFEHPIFRPQQDLYMLFYVVSFKLKL